MSTETVSPQVFLFDTVYADPDLRFFIAYLSGRLGSNTEVAQQLVDYYKEWKSLRA